MEKSLIAAPYKYVWRWKVKFPERFGMPCRIVKQDRKSIDITVEFEDGVRVTAGRFAVRMMKSVKGQGWTG